MEELLVIMLIVNIFMFIFEGRKKYSKERQEEARRYFNGSIVEGDGGQYRESGYTHGLALVRDKKTGRCKFKRQSKMVGWSLLS